jgi:hypothetical protein
VGGRAASDLGSGHRSRLEWWVVAGAFIAVSLLSSLTQERISLHDGRGSDGVIYFGVAAQLSVPTAPRARAPFVYRVGTPWLVSLLPGPVRLAQFQAVNLAGAALATGLLVVFLRCHLRDWRVRAALAIAFMAPWHGPVRFPWFYPTSVEPWGHVFVLTALLALEWVRASGSPRSILALVAASGVGVAFREAVALVPLAALFVTNPLPGAAPGSRRVRFSPWIVAAPLSALAVIALLQAWATPTNEYGFVSQVVRFVGLKVPWRYPLAWFITFGPLLVLLVDDSRNVVRFCLGHQDLLAFGAGVAILAYVAGSDTERFLFWSMPVILVLVGRSIELGTARSATRSWWLVLIASQCVSQRLFWMTPDITSIRSLEQTVANESFVLLTPWSGEGPFRDVLAFASRDVALEAIAQYSLLLIVLLVWIRIARRLAPR